MELSEQISWCVALVVKPGQLDNFMKLTQAMVASTRNEPGVLSYQRFVGDDNKIVHAQERYVDSGAALMHLQNFAEEFAERFVSMVDRTVARKAVSVSRSCSVERADSMDPAPSAANALAVANPMPRLEPVTSATLPRNLRSMTHSP